LLSFVTKAYHKQDATIYTIEGKKLDVKITVFEMNIILTAPKIRYYLAGKNKNIPLSKIDRVDIGSKSYTVISYKKEIKTGPNRGKTKTIRHLSELLKDGLTKLYVTYSVGENGVWVNGSFLTSGKQYLIQNKYLKKNEKVKHITKSNFKEHLILFFNNCDLEKKEINFNDIEFIVEHGNKNCI